MDQRNSSNESATPRDAREATAEQRQTQEQLEHLDEDPDAPGVHQSRHQLPDESTR